MNENFKLAEKCVRAAITDLERILSCDGENISYYNAASLDHSINYLVEAKTYMSLGRVIDNK